MKHRMIDGQKIEIIDMDDRHLINTMRLIRRRSVEGLVVRRGSIGIDGDMYYDEDHLYGYEALDCLNYENYEIEFKKRGLDVKKLHTEKTP